MGLSVSKIMQVLPHSPWLLLPLTPCVTRRGERVHNNFCAGADRALGVVLVADAVPQLPAAAQLCHNVHAVLVLVGILEGCHIQRALQLPDCIQLPLNGMLVVSALQLRGLGIHNCLHRHTSAVIAMSFKGVAE